MPHLQLKTVDDSKQHILLSVILPIHNEENILWHSALSFGKHFDRVVGIWNWQYVLVENGSSDASREIAEKIVSHRPTSKLLVLKKADYGNALREGLLASQGKWSLIMNVDHLWDTPFFDWSWANRNNYDLIMGSKRADPTLNKQDQYRRVLSAGLNSILQYLFNCVCSDSHGMKLLRTKTLTPVANACVMRRGQFDTELVLRSLRGFFWVAEVPIPYIEKRKQKNLMIVKIMNNVLDILRLYRAMKTVPYCGNVRYRRFCREDLMQLQLSKDNQIATNSI
jgi:glycosyltransferase involved in cell wall biosynthesis